MRGTSGFLGPPFPATPPQGQDWNHMRAVVHDGLPVARGAAAIINLNCALLLIPVCRNLVHKLRGAFGVRFLTNQDPQKHQQPSPCAVPALGAAAV